MCEARASHSIRRSLSVFGCFFFGLRTPGPTVYCLRLRTALLNRGVAPSRRPLRRFVVFDLPSDFSSLPIISEASWWAGWVSTVSTVRSLVPRGFARGVIESWLAHWRTNHRLGFLKVCELSRGGGEALSPSTTSGRLTLPPQSRGCVRGAYWAFLAHMFMNVFMLPFGMSYCCLSFCKNKNKGYALQRII